MMTTEFIIALGAVTAALIAGFFSFLNLVIAKEQKVSEFRQAWADALREDISKYISNISFISESYRVRDIDDEGISNHEFIKTLQPNYDEASSSYTSIFLRINPDDTDPELRRLNLAFLSQLHQVRSAVHDERYEEAFELASELKTLSHPILKAEWERVKSGEPTYKRSRIFAFSLLMAGFIMIGAIILTDNSQSSLPSVCHQPVPACPVDQSISQLALLDTKIDSVLEHQIAFFDITDTLSKQEKAILSKISSSALELDRHLDRHLEILAKNIRNESASKQQ